MTEPNLAALLNDAKDKRKADRRKDDYGDPEIGRRNTQRRLGRQHAKEHYTQMARIAQLEDYLRILANALERDMPHTAAKVRKLLADDQK